MPTHYVAVIIYSCILFCGTLVDGATINGVVKDGNGAAINGAIVHLGSDTLLRDTTDEGGVFVIVNETALRSRGLTSDLPNSGPVISIAGTSLRIISAVPIVQCRVALFSGNGKQLLTGVPEKTTTGVHALALPERAPGCYLLTMVLNGVTTTHLLMSTGRSFTHNTQSHRTPAGSTLDIRAAASMLSDTLFVQKKGFKPLKEPVPENNQGELVIVLDRTSSPTINVSSLPIIKEMPDPLAMLDGTKVTTPEQWKKRRREMIRILEDYEYGHMPPPPENVTAAVATPLSRITAGGKEVDYRMMHLTFGPDKKCGFAMGIFTPITPPPEQGYPILISLDYSSGKTSLGASSAAIARGYAVATIKYTDLGADANNYKSTAFYPFYPEYDWRDFSAWAWGLSRAVDYLVTDTLVDKEKIMVTGTSRTGQAALLAGAFDERIALTAPVAGGMALRFSGKEMGGGLGQGITEVVDQNTIWFGPLFEKFRNQTPRLPCDQHWLPALTAPRLFILCNSFSDEYGRAYAALQTYLAAKPVYDFLGTPDNIGQNFRDGGHGMTSEDWSALLDFADQMMLKKPGTRTFDAIPPASKTP